MIGLFIIGLHLYSACVSGFIALKLHHFDQREIDILPWHYRVLFTIFYINYLIKIYGQSAVRNLRFFVVFMYGLYTHSMSAASAASTVPSIIRYTVKRRHEIILKLNSHAWPQIPHAWLLNSQSLYFMYNFKTWSRSLFSREG